MPPVGRFVVEKGAPSWLHDALDRVRDGTHRFYRSEWTQVRPGATKTFTHDLAEVPMIVDVIKSEQATGALAAAAGSDATVASKTERVVTVTNNHATKALYFQVRAI